MKHHYAGFQSYMGAPPAHDLKDLPDWPVEGTSFIVPPYQAIIISMVPPRGLACHISLCTNCER